MSQQQNSQEAQPQRRRRLKRIADTGDDEEQLQPQDKIVEEPATQQ